MRKAHTRALMLNSDYSPIGLISWKKAIRLSVINQGDPKEGVFMVDFFKDDYVVASKGIKYPIPAVVALAKYVGQKRRPAFSRSNVFIRDHITCQYCGEVFRNLDLLTYDHVVPRDQWKKKKMRGTPTNWTNIVTCCRPCNNRKRNLTPEEAGMLLKRQPVTPSASHYILGLKPWDYIHPEWELYLTPWYKKIRELREKLPINY
jgi:5-methylcytosine-specific restriction endonuclease McrA